MTIETRYNIGDKVWMFLINQPEEVKITGIEYTYHRIFVGCKYYIKSNDCDYEISLPESLLFPTKEELLKSL